MVRTGRWPNAINRALLAACVAAVMLTLAVAPASAAPHPRVTTVQNVSGDSPWHGLGCITPQPEPFGWASGLPQTTEPMMAVNPNNPSEQVASWIDNDGGPLNTSFSRDGGRSWTQSLPINRDTCTGLPHENGITDDGGADPFVAWGPDGTVYFSGLRQVNFYADPENYQDPTMIEHTTKRDKYQWSPAVQSNNPPMVDDRPVILADNKNAGMAHLVFRNAGFGVPAPRGVSQLVYNRTTDGGDTWSRTVIADVGLSPFTFGTQTVQLADGTLVIVSSVPASMGGGTRAFKSTDRGVTWSAPQSALPVAPASTPPGQVCDTAVGFPTGTGNTAVLNGTSIVFPRLARRTPSGPTDFYLVRSDDAGQTWTQTLVYTSPYLAALPSIAADSQGRIGLVFDEVDRANVQCSGQFWPNNGGQKMTLPARARFIVSDDAGQTWSAPLTIGAPWWNYASAPVQNYFFESVRLGDYQGITAVPHRGFATVTIEGQELEHGPNSPEITGLQSTVVGQIAVSPQGT